MVNTLRRCTGEEAVVVKDPRSGEAVAVFEELGWIGRVVDPPGLSPETPDQRTVAMAGLCLGAVLPAADPP